MSKLIVIRRSEFLNRSRNIRLYLDNQPIGTVANGESYELDLKPRNYSLKAKIDWCGSQKYVFSISEGELKKMKLTGFTKNKWIVPILAMIQLLLIVITFYVGLNSIFLTLYSISLLWVIFYPISLGRNKYLRLVEDYS